MQQFTNLWANLDTRKRAIVLGASAVVFLGVVVLARIAAQPNYTLLYSGLDPKASGEVIAALDAQGVAYDVRNSAIYVDSTNRDALRLTLAAEGLPASTSNGYELLDNLSGFGTTSQMFDAAYLRAKEGELARTILANPKIQAARVHIAQSGSRPFRKTAEPKASVSIRAGSAGISPDAAEAIRFLVASAVSDLRPDDVSVIDADRGIVIAQDTASTPAKEGEDKALLLKQNVERLIEARTGAGKAIVEINVETLTDDETIIERRFDPDGRVVVSTQTQETSRSSQNSEAGAVTVASNLPDGDAAAGGDESNSQNSETQETINYELSETTRELRKTPGAIKRISVAVLVDGIEQTDPSGETVWVPRQEDELAMLEDLVKSAIGFDEARGDSVTIRSMQMPLAEPMPPGDEVGWASGRSLDLLKLTQLGVTSLVVLALGFFVVRPILLAASSPTSISGSDPKGAQNVTAVPALDGEIQPPVSQTISAQSGDLPAVGTISAGDPALDPVVRLKSLIEERQEETVEILRGWIETPEKTI